MAYILIRLIAVAILAFPVLAGISVAIIDLFYNTDYAIDISQVFIVSAFSLFYYSWSFFLFTLVPYSFLYILIPMKGWNWIYKFLLFCLLLLITGFIVPEASVMEAFNVNPYPRALYLYFLLTISLCSLCNSFLNKKAHFHEAHNTNY